MHKVIRYYERSQEEAMRNPAPLVVAPPRKKGPPNVYHGPSKKTRAKRAAKAKRD